MGDEERDWLVGRYHNNLAYIDSVLTPFLERLPDDATVILLSDHGEEFWDHGDFEHGHSLYDELLRVPMIARGPGFPPGPTTPPPPSSTLRRPSSKPLASRHRLKACRCKTSRTLMTLCMPTVPSAFDARFTASDVGVVRGTHKYTTWKSTETVVDLSEDPEEARNLLPREADALEWREHLSAALRTPGAPAYTLYPQRSSRAGATTVDMTVPGRHSRGAGERGSTLMSAVETTHHGEHAQHTWAANMRGA